MVIVGVDYHPSVQQVAFTDTETGECGERRLNHSGGEAEKFYRDSCRFACRIETAWESR
jgi:transposase